MGQLGSLALTAIGYVVGGPWGAFAGSLIGSFAFPDAMPRTIQPQQDMPELNTVSGFGGTLVAANVPIPVNFGTVRTGGNIVQAHILGERNSRLLCVIVLGEYLGAPSPTLAGLWVSGVPFANLSTYAAARADDASWYEFYPSGPDTSIAINNTGDKPIGAQLSEGDNHVSYPITLYGGGDVTVNVNHYSPEAGSTQNWVIDYKVGTDGAWVNLGSYSQTFQKQVQYEVPDACGGTSTESKNVEGYTRTSHTFTVAEGDLYFRVSVTTATNEGYILFESVSVDADAGKTLDILYPNTTCLLVNLIKTDEIGGAEFVAETVNGRSNPVDAMEFILADTELGMGLDTEIDSASFNAARTWCTANGRSIDGSFASIAYDRALAMICQAAGLLLIRTGGRFKIVPDEAGSVVVGLDADEDCLPGSVGWRGVDYQGGFNQLIASYVDASDNYTTHDILAEDAALIDADGYVRERRADLGLIRDMGRAQLRAEELYKVGQAANLLLEFQTGIRHTALEPGDILRFTHAGLGWNLASDRRFRILSVQEVDMDADNGAFGFQVLAIRHDPAAYLKTWTWNNWHPVPDVPVLPPSPPTSLLPSIQINTLTQEVVPDGTGQYWSKLRITFTVPSDTTVNLFRLWARPETDNAFSELATTQRTGVFEVILPEAWIIWHLRITCARTSTGDEQNHLLAPQESYYATTAPQAFPGYGGGRFGAQPYGA